MLPHLRPIPIKDRMSILFIEYGNIDVIDGAFVVVDKTGVRTQIPVGSIACLMLEPGTRVSHAAAALASRVGTLLIWVGEGGGAAGWRAFGQTAVSGKAGFGRRRSAQSGALYVRNAIWGTAASQTECGSATGDRRGPCERNLQTIGAAIQSATERPQLRCEGLGQGRCGQ